MKQTTTIFLAVPPSLKDEIRHFSHKHDAEDSDEDSADEAHEHEEENTFEIDPSILLPVELEEGEKTLDPAELSWEMIISGMLKVISFGGKNLPASVSLGKDGKGKKLSATPIKHGDLISGEALASVPSEWVDYYRRFVLTIKPEIYHEFTNASIVKAGNEEFDLALEISGILEGLFPGSPGVLLNKALILENRAAAHENSGNEADKENAEAREAYEAALTMEPVLPDAWFNAGFFFMRQRDFTRAKECFSCFISAGEESEFPMEIPAEKLKQAKKIINDINNQGLDDEKFREAYDLINRGKEESGLSKIREFIEQHPKVWNGWFVLGWALRKLGRYADGLEALHKATELGGGNCDIQNEIAICLMETGDLKEARKELEHALREEPENIKIISNLGVLAMKAGNDEEACAFFRTVLELDPDDEIAQQYLKAYT